MTLDPKQTTFVLLSFEGPDVYSQAGGLGVRVKGLSRALARLGFHTFLYFVGDPELPAEEDLEDGRLHLRRWSQWISAQHRAGVYDGEEGKLRDWNFSLPLRLVDRVIAPAVEAGHRVVVLGEEWQTSWSMKLVSDLLAHRGLRDSTVMLWNANNTFGFHRIDWPSLNAAAAVTTVSRYMKYRMWDHGQNPIVIPNGIPREALADADAGEAAAVRAATPAEHLWFKIGRFDPDKRWVMAVSAAGELKRRGHKVKLLIRGGREHHGVEVLAHARREGLVVRDAVAPTDAGELVALLARSDQADVVNLTSFVADQVLALTYAASDAVLANSGHEPFGLVGLEVMASGGLAVTGSTGEDYAEPYRNAVVLETDDPLEIVTELTTLKQQPARAARLRRHGRATARDYTWDRIIGQLDQRIEFVAAHQGVTLPSAPAPRPRLPVRKKASV